jgi:4-amino-4-deoxy-L-arabinose transferase-like glycosyltransferase
MPVVRTGVGSGSSEPRIGSPGPSATGLKPVPPSGRRFWTVLVLVLFAAVVIRVFFIFAVSHHERTFYDATYYRYAAVQVADGEGFRSVSFLGKGRPDAPHPPLTVLVLTPAAWLFGPDDLPMRFTMTLVGLASIVVIAMIARAVGGERAGLIAAFLAAVYPNLWVNDGLIMSESISALTVGLTILLTYRLVVRPTPARAAAVGAACGLAVLTRAEVALLLPLVIAPAIVMVRRVSWKGRAGLLGVVTIVATVMLVPWVAYNLSRFEKPVLLSNGDGGAILGANCRETYYGSGVGGWNLACSERGVTRGDASDDDVSSRRLAFRYMADHVGRLPVVMAARMGRTWSVYRPLQLARETRIEGRPRAVSIAGLAMFYLLAPAVVGGVVVLRRRRVTPIPLFGTIVMVTLIAALVRGEVRFRTPAEVGIVVLAAVAIDAMAFRYKRPVPAVS